MDAVMTDAMREEAPSVTPLPADIKVLTSMRYLAALWVVLHHYSAYFADQPLPLGWLIHNGAIGVDFFFVLSGFVIAHVYSAKLVEGRFDYWSFITRRLARVYPLHFAMLVLTVAFGVVAMKAGWTFALWSPAASLEAPKGEIMRSLFANVTLIHAWGAVDGLKFNLPSWSISAEWFAYLTFPAMALFVLRARNAAVSIGVALVILFALLAASRIGVLPPLVKMTWNLGAIRIVPEFLLGLGLHRLASNTSVGRGGALAGIAASLFALFAILYLDLATQFAVVALTALIFFMADAERHGALKSFIGPFPVLLGEISYSVYMIHLPVGMAFFELVFPALRQGGLVAAMGGIAACAVLVTILSWLSHRFYELPARAALIRLSKLPSGFKSVRA